MANIIPKDINFWAADAEQIFRKLIESVRVGVYIADAEGNLVYVNETFMNILGYLTKEELLGKNLARELYVNPPEREIFLQEMSKFGFVRDYEVRNRRKDGSAAILAATSNFIRDEAGEVVGVEGIVHDITEKKHLEERLAFEKDKLEQILFFDEKVSSLHEFNQVLDFIVQKSCEILEAERCSLMILDEQTDELCIKAARGLLPEVIEQTRIKLGESIAGYVAQEGKAVLVRNIEYDKHFGRKNREGYATRSFMVAPIKMNHRVIGVVNLADKKVKGISEFSDIDLKILEAIVREAAVAFDNAKLYRELKQLSILDPITRIGNYRYFVKTLDHEIERIKRFTGRLCLLMIDIDDFKRYNDSHGHVAGDDLLRTIGETLRKNLRAIDQVCRYGGDEFVVILPGIDREQAKVVAEKILSSIAQIKLKAQVTVSIGLAEYQDHFDRLELTTRADRAMYRAKREGKNTVCSYN